jgi:hypothetical protein
MKNDKKMKTIEIIIIIIGILVSNSITYYISNNQLETTKQHFDKQYELLLEQFERTVNRSLYLDKEFYNRTKGEIIIFYPQNQSGNKRYELVGFFIKNNLSGGLYNLKFILSINIKNAVAESIVSDDFNYTIGFKPVVSKYREWLNNSILKWDEIIPQNTTLSVVFNISWNVSWHHSMIEIDELYMKMFACDRFIDLTGKIRYGTKEEILHYK